MFAKKVGLIAVIFGIDMAQMTNYRLCAVPFFLQSCTGAIYILILSIFYLQLMLSILNSMLMEISGVWGFPAIAIYTVFDSTM